MDRIFQGNLKRKLLSMTPEEIQQLAKDLSEAAEMAKQNSELFIRKINVISIVLAH